MEKENKYWLREKGLPYYYEYALTKNPGVFLKMFEIFDGREVKWGVREDFITIYGEKYCRMTPLFENLIENQDSEEYKDKERIIYLKDYKLLIQGKLNNSEVLCKFNDDNSLDTPLVEIKDFGGKDVKIHELNSDTALVEYKENDEEKYVYFDYNSFNTCSNSFDVIYNENYFIKSYIINGKIRMFLGKLSYPVGVVREIGYDINKNEFICFPLDEYGLIDENEMKNRLHNSKTMGFNISMYKFIDRKNLVNTLFNFGVHSYDVKNRLNKYNHYNDQKIIRK